MVRQWQEIFYDERYQSTPMVNPDFVKLAEAYGIPAMRVTKREEMAASVEFARSHAGPVLIEYVIEKEEMVYPMVPAGADLDKMLRRPKPGEVVGK
jgi:acetolactate synthase-1/2/3 large subunit